VTITTEAIPREERLAYKRAWEKWRRGTGPKPVRPSETIVLDSGPLLSFLAREHTRVWMQAYWLDVARRGRARKGAAHGKAFSLDHTAERLHRRAVDREARWVVACKIAEGLGMHPNNVHEHIQKWRQGKTVNIWLADRIVGAFGRHISEVYGSEWECPA
jgi:hypothetical protein